MNTSSQTNSVSAPKLRVLFFAEAVTLAHVGRPLALARTLDRTEFDVCFAVDPRYNAILGDLPFATRSIHSIPSAQFLESLATGKPLFSTEAIAAYVEEDLQVINEFRPDVIVGDFRLSLQVSARKAGIRYIAIANAYWSPYAQPIFPMPDMPLANKIGLPLAEALFRLVRPIGFTLHNRPMNVIRKRYGMKSVGSDIRRFYTDADEVLYADLPELVPTFNRPTTHHYIGPVPWSPVIPLPEWWEDIPDSNPIVYITLGTSGEVALLDTILRALDNLPITVLAATAGRTALKDVQKKIFFADYLPGEASAARAQLVISNGGSPTTYQALAAGVPVLGIPTNMDQHINMHYVQQSGTGLALRAAHVSASSIKSAVEQLLNDERYAQNANRLREIASHYHAPTRFQSALRGFEPDKT